MTPERWRELTTIFHAAREHEGAERAAYLDRACGGDASLRAELESLLAAQGTLGAGPTAAPQLSAGTMFGLYRVDELIGAGGMGQVYRATDSRLQRTVALKLLLPELTRDPGFSARFEREARLLASLNHPNVAAIYGFEQVDDVLALVLEYVDGQTLEQVIAGPRQKTSGIEQTLLVARQIALALEAAHDKGIIHRDLKPSNVKITPAGVVKVLDFGIARVSDEEMPHAETLAVTHAGAVIGTAAYMSPEQARGLRVDRRTDIWAFGCVLYEMLTGRGAFAGATASDSLAKVLEREPEWSALPASAPESILRLVKRCLQKDPADRLRDIADARLEIDEALARPVPAVTTPARPRSYVPLILMALAVAALVLLAAAIWWRPFQPRQVDSAAGPAMELPIVFPSNAMPADGLAISPDGRQIAANVWTNSGSIWIAPLDGSPPKPLAGGEGGTTPFWSPDSSTIGFFRGQLSDAAELVTISANGGPVTRVASLPLLGGAAGGSWNAKGVIVFSLGGKIFRVQATGGDPVELPLSGVKGRPRSPAFVSDGQHFIFCADHQTSGSIYVASLDDGKATELGESDCPGGVAPGDYVLFLRRGALVASKLDLPRLALVGDSRVVATGVTRGALGPWPQLTPSASTTGVLAIPALRGGSPLGQLTWFDRNGKITGAIALPAEPGAEYLNPVISPTNAQLVAANRMDPQSGAWHVWVIDGARGNAASRLTTDPSSDRDPAWSRDGKEIVYASDRGGEWAFYRQPYAGGAAVRLPVDLTEAVEPMPSDWAVDRLLFSQLQRSIWAVLLGDRRPTALGDWAYGPHLSPDGHWMAYAAAPDRHRFEVFVERFPSGSPRRQITTDGGGHPRWIHTAKGTELVYWSVTEGIVSVPLSLNDQAIQIGAAQVLVPQVLSLIDARTAYDITPDGQKILVRELAKSPPTGGIRVIVNWMAKLK